MGVVVDAEQVAFPLEGAVFVGDGGLPLQEEVVAVGLVKEVQGLYFQVAAAQGDAVQGVRAAENVALGGLDVLAFDAGAAQSLLLGGFGAEVALFLRKKLGENKGNLREDQELIPGRAVFALELQDGLQVGEHPQDVGAFLGGQADLGGLPGVQHRAALPQGGIAGPDSAGAEVRHLLGGQEALLDADGFFDAAVADRETPGGLVVACPAIQQVHSAVPPLVGILARSSRKRLASSSVLTQTV